MHNRRFAQLQAVRKRALDIMGRMYDPFHDEFHPQEVEQTAMRIYKKVHTSIRSQVNLHQVRLLSLLHDTSRKVIGTNLFLEPILGGYVSGSIGYGIMMESGYDHTESAYIRSIIRNHESFLGLWKYPMDTNGKIFSDADCVESYSPKRLHRALEYFEKNKFSNALLNIYVAGLITVHRYARPTFFYDASKQLCDQNVRELRTYVLHKKSYFEKVLYGRICRSFYSIDFLL